MQTKWEKSLVWIIKYSDSSKKQLAKLDRVVAKRILDYMDERVTVAADPRAGAKVLTGPNLGSYVRYRVGDYRIICHVEDKQLIILVIEVGHRREVYR